MHSSTTTPKSSRNQARTPAEYSSQAQSNNSYFEYKEEALPFIVYDQEQRRFTFTEESARFLGSIEGPIGVIAVAGMYRTGKSYLLNRMLLNRSNGFGVGPTINPCTKGLWVWGTPVQGYTPDGDPIKVLIVDTEGLGALDEDSNHDVRIFSLAILLSSYFIYNSVGSIDESALSNLSLVINLTKNIQIKSKNGGNASLSDETDLDEYGMYFPSFMWVVRDFTLQLVDQEGEPITSREYLDKALELQKGFSEAVEQKNRIRRLLKSFFKERDCCTMIIPLTNEENLQNLANMDLEELRPDFVEQVMQLRKKVINRVKVKTLNGKKLTGAMMLNLADSYVSAINHGAVPNIETAWSYICKSECQKAIQESLIQAENQIREISAQLPLNEDQIAIVCKQVKQEAVSSFQKKAVGTGISEEYIKELKTKLNALSVALKEENERVAQQMCLNFLQESYSHIEKKLKNREFPGGFAEFYDTDLRNFQQYFLQNGPAGPYRQLLLLEFVQRATAEAADYFSRSISNELELQKQILTDHKIHLENQIKEAKQDFQRERDHFEQRIRASDHERAELQAIEITLKETIARLNESNSELQTELTQQISSQKSDYLREIEDCQQKMAQQEATISELSRKIMQKDSEQEKDKALLEQKSDFLERQISELQKKDTDVQSEFATMKRDHLNQIREINSKYETQLRTLNTSLDDAQEKVIDLTAQLEELQQKYTFEKSSFEDAQKQIQSSANISNQQYTELVKQLETLKTKSKQDVDRLSNELSLAREELKMKEEELTHDTKDKDEEIKSIKNNFEKEVAIYKQKLEFKEVQYQQIKTQLDETRKTHETMIKAIENKSREQVDGKEYAQKQVSEMKEQHLLELQELELRHQQTKQELEQQLEHLNEKYQDIDLRYKLLQAEHDQETESLKGQVNTLESARQKALEQSKSLDVQKLKLLEEAERRHKSTIEQLERELEDRDQKSSLELRDLQSKSEESLKQLKNFYELEKERLESRITEERERASKKYTLQHEEFEQRLRDEQTQHEEDIELLQEELRDSQGRYQSYQAQAEHEIALLSQKIDTLEAYLREKEERLNKEQSMTAQQIDAQMERFNNERRELFSKQEQISMNLTAKDRELTSIKNKFEAQSEELDKRRKQLEDLRQEFNQERQKLNDKIDQLRQKNQELADENISSRLESGRELALYKQKLEFQQKKIDDLQKMYDEQYTKYEERMTLQKQEYSQEVSEMQQRYQAQKEQQETKYESKRKQFKENEQALLKQIGELNKERAILEEKLSSIDFKNSDTRTKLEVEVVHLREQLSATNESWSRERETFLSDCERLRGQVLEQERHLNQVEADYEKDKALWGNKFTFLEQQRDQAKSDLQDVTRKFEMTLEQLQKRGNADKDRVEQSQHNLITSIESKFKQQMKEHFDSAQREKNDFIEKMKALERENKTLQSRLQIDQKDKVTEIHSLQKKVSDLIESEGRLQTEIDELKAERDRRAIEGLKGFEKERETLKLKIQDLEIKLKEENSKRQQQTYEFEMEKSKLSFDKNALVQYKQEIQETIERLQRKNEDLLKDNERLRSDRQYRKHNPQVGAPVTQSKFGGFNPINLQSKFGVPLTKENPNVNSSQMFAQGFNKFIGDGSSQFSSDPQIQQQQQQPFTVRENYLGPNSISTNIRARMGSPNQPSSHQPLTQHSLMMQGGALSNLLSKPALSSTGSSKSNTNLHALIGATGSVSGTPAGGPGSSGFGGGGPSSTGDETNSATQE